MEIITGATLSHNELVKIIFKMKAEIKKNKVVSLFLSSFSTNNLSNRSGLSVYAIMQTFPNHKFVLRENQKLHDFSPCEICSCSPQESIVEDDIELISESFSEIGGLVTHGTLFDYYYYLSETDKLSLSKPNSNDIRIFSEILNILMTANEEDTIKKGVFSRIGRISGFKSNSEQRQVLLETLGYCSILETSEHKGLLNQYTNLAVAPSKTHSSDWNYPVDFWLGKDGINKEALKFWFGEYQELKKFWD